MKRLLLVCVLASGYALGQTGPTVVRAAYGLDTLPNVAPGQLLTVFVSTPTVDNIPWEAVRAPAGATLPTSLAGVSVALWAGTTLTTPVLEVSPVYTCIAQDREGCGVLMAVTFQIPFEVQPQCLTCSGIPAVGFGITDADGQGSLVDATPYSDQIHILTACDVVESSDTIGVATATGLPCAPKVTHADGSLVTWNNPAKGGEYLVAYAVGLGQTTPNLKTGEIVTSAATANTAFTLDFNFRQNALAVQPLRTGPKPLYAGATPGYVGLYQINFVVPAVPVNTPACANPLNLVDTHQVQSNLTVSIGGDYSFDGAGICVVPN